MWKYGFCNGLGGISKKGVFGKMRLLFQILQKRKPKKQEKLGVVTTLDNCEVVKMQILLY